MIGVACRQRALRYLPLASLGALALGAAVVLRRVDPYAPDNLLPPCPFYALTGLWCPGCGSTRCLHALAHFDVPQAMSMNPLLVLALAPLLLMALHAASLLPARAQALTAVLLRPMPWIVLLSGYWVLRNLPWFPFTLLAPG